MKIKFNCGENKLGVVKVVKQALSLSVKEAKDAVEAGEIEVDNSVDSKELCLAITDAGGKIISVQSSGKIIPSVEDVVLPSKRDALDMFLEGLLSGENKGKDSVNETRVVVNCAQEIVIVSNISISERLYQRLVIIRADELKELQKHIRLVAGLNLVPGTDKMEPTSCLAVRVPFHHNTTEEIKVLSDVARTIHETILDAASKTAVFDNIEKDLKPFYDE